MGQEVSWFGWFKSFFAGVGRQMSLAVGLVCLTSKSSEVNSDFAFSLMEI